MEATSPISAPLSVASNDYDKFFVTTPITFRADIILSRLVSWASGRRWVWLLLVAGPASYGQSSDQTSYAELKRSSVVAGKKVFEFVQVLPPSLPLATAAKGQSGGQGDRQEVIERLSKKKFVALSFTAEVWPGKQTYSILRWFDSDRNIEHLAISKTDLRYFLHPVLIETADAIYSWLPIVIAHDESETSSDSVGLSRLKRLAGVGASEYYLDDVSKTSDSSDDSIQGGLDALHAYYKVNLSELRSHYNEDVISPPTLAGGVDLPEGRTTTIHWWVTPVR